MTNSVWQVAAVALCAAAVLGAPQRPQDQQAVISRLDSDISPDGSFTYTYETSNGIRADARGQQVGPESLSVQGQFSYTADDGTPIQLQYLADENGFQPQGAHLPTPPPIPEAILKSIEFNRQNPEPQEGQPPAAGRRFG
ncbi:endocuticle structural glycoprotein SgAbd-2-like [Frankliniella occidentalis]|uniref:Endocuticle structural glycoprotein SgAbd-2-like n=1 Tax=Frankliniella occidentalis TaxID=133901 RepID=A0A9C6XAQ2_FRAOC|nr:endocuticle structural glycoprotein SgAbd-2-like [Frankliniella occidentalis]